MHLALACLLLAATAGPDEPRPRILGAQLSAGAPQGFELAVAIRPLGWLRATGGLAHNLLGPGLTASATVMPPGGGARPTLTLAAGRYFETDVSGRLSGTFPRGLDPALARFAYAFYAALAGVEWGASDGLRVFARGGVSWVRSSLGDVSAYRPPNSDVTVDVSSPRLQATMPTVDLGLVLPLW